MEIAESARRAMAWRGRYSACSAPSSAGQRSARRAGSAPARIDEARWRRAGAPAGAKHVPVQEAQRGRRVDGPSGRLLVVILAVDGQAVLLVVGVEGGGRGLREGEALEARRGGEEGLQVPRLGDVDVDQRQAAQVADHGPVLDQPPDPALRQAW